MTAETIALLGHALDFIGVLIVAWVAWKVNEVAHQNNSMRDELEDAARAKGLLKGRANAEEEQRKRDG